MNGPAPLPTGRFGAILCDPPWHFEAWSRNGYDRHPSRHYHTMATGDICALPVRDLAADDCVLFLWTTWPLLEAGLETIRAWGFRYKTCAFDWLKANNTQPDFFQDELPAQVGTGYWTRANSEPCLLATRGHPKRLNADVRQGIIAPRREHSRKPDGIHERIERLVAGPYLELFARQSHPGWVTWGNERTKFDPSLSRKESWEEMWAKPFHRPEAKHMDNYRSTTVLPDDIVTSNPL
jgi:N6-adenosine-specific RNA methylase IME4